ncbi:MAG: outer membrane beta-barrel protein, partial [Saprospiraceae bacterium]
LSVQNAKLGYYAGLFGSFNRGSFLLQPEVLFNANRIDYSFKDFKNPKIVDTIKTERYSQIDIPVLLGAKVGPVLLKAGPVAHIHLGSNSELTSIAGFTEKWRTALWGYQVGIGLGFSSRMHLDIRYEGNFDKWGSHINIGGSDFNFSQKPSRWLVNVGYAF